MVSDRVVINLGQRAHRGDDGLRPGDGSAPFEDAVAAPFEDAVAAAFVARYRCKPSNSVLA
jgi:hypothetical protein